MAGSIVTGIGAVLLTSEILIEGVGSWVKVCVGADAAGAAQEARTGTTSRKSFVYFISIAS